jgi:hypothetical protein
MVSGIAILHEQMGALTIEIISRPIGSVTTRGW